VNAIVMAVLVLSMILPVAITFSQINAQSTLTVEGGFLEIDVIPAETYGYVMTVKTGPDTPTVDIEVTAVGFGSLASGNWAMVNVEDDQSPYSCRDYIIEITPNKFTLEPNGSQDVRTRLRIPDTFDYTAGYAMLHVVTQPIGTNTASMRAAVDVPVIIKTRDAAVIKEGTITGVRIGEVESGEPIAIFTTFENTGNFHYRAENEVVIFDNKGTQLGKAVTPLVAQGIIPTYSVDFKTLHNLLSSNGVVEAGTYQVTSTVWSEDGSVLDTMTTSFTIEEPYEPKAGIDRDSVCIFPFEDIEPGPFECKDADVILSFQGTGIVTGEAIIGKYTKVPATAIEFSAPIEKGGTGLKALKYIDIEVLGVEKGMASIRLSYSDFELGEVKEPSLLLAIWNGEKWVQLKNLEVFTGANYITGDVEVRGLVGTPIGLGGEGDTGGAGMRLWIILPIVGGLVFIVIVFALIKRRRGVVEEAQ